MSSRIYHITTRADANAAAASGLYTHRSLSEEGFIHCSTAGQLLTPANERFRGREDLVLLELDEEALGDRVVYEDSYGSGTEFPHVYGTIVWSAVLALVEFPCSDDGRFSLPASLRSDQD